MPHSGRYACKWVMRIKVSCMAFWTADSLREVEVYSLFYFLCHINITISSVFFEFCKFLLFIFSIICSYFWHMPGPVNLITLTSFKHITTQLIPFTHHTDTHVTVNSVVDFHLHTMRGVTQTRERIKFCCLLFGAGKEIDRSVIAKKGSWLGMGNGSVPQREWAQSKQSSMHRTQRENRRVKERGRETIGTSSLKHLKSIFHFQFQRGVP